MVLAEVSHCILQLEQANKKPLCNCYAYISAMERDPLGSVFVALKQFFCTFFLIIDRSSYLLVCSSPSYWYKSWQSSFIWSGCSSLSYKLHLKYSVSCIFYILLFHNYTSVSCCLSRNSWKPEIACSLMWPQAVEIQMRFLLSWNCIKTAPDTWIGGRRQLLLVNMCLSLLVLLNDS